MSRSDDSPEVIQGRLGWEDGDITEASPDELEPHPKNTEIYGDTDDADDLDAAFVESVREKGVLEPLVITDGKQIISGHRRWLAAKATDTDSVPVRKSSFDDALAEREALIEFNRQRDKTPGQIVNEFEETLEIEKERAKERQSEAGEKFGKGGGNVSTSNSEGKARDKAAEKVNADVSGRTLEKAKKVKDKAESEDEPEPVREAAQEAWEGLQTDKESFNSAYQEVKTAEKQYKKEQSEQAVQDSINKTTTESDTPDIEPGDVIRLGKHRLFCGDSSSDEFRELLPDTDTAFAFCDPPYGADAAEWDGSFVWDHDYLIETAETVAVTPGIESIPQLMRRTEMPYRWSVSAWIDNGMTRGALGFGNWIYVSLFSRADSLHSNSQDMARISVSTDDDRPEHKGRKPIGLMTWLYERFVDADTAAIIDPFAGSGTTILTAERQLETPVYAAELDNEFCEQIATAWEDLTGRDAEVVE